MTAARTIVVRAAVCSTGERPELSGGLLSLPIRPGRRRGHGDDGLPGPVSTIDDIDDVIRRMAEQDFLFDAKVEAGLVSPAEIKAYEAHRAEMIAELDRRQGTADVTYAQFRQAFDAGASCQTLFALKNAMHPKDVLKEAANEDLRRVKCFSPRATRQDPN